MTEDQAKDKIYGICNSIDAIAGYFRGAGFESYYKLLMGAKEFILKGLKNDETT